MPNWTLEQLDAINKEGSNIIVSAGAGSGKTAVLSERVLRKVKEGVSVDSLLILTFTKAAAIEMKERIRKKLKEGNFISELDKIDNAYITTFDSYALSIVRKYNHLLNVSKDISIVDSTIINIKKQEIIDNLFDRLYCLNNPLFLKLIDDFCSKDDYEIKYYIIDINNKLDMLYDKENFLENYVSNFYSLEFINTKVLEYEQLLLKKVFSINKYLLQLEEFVDADYFGKINKLLGELLLSDSYESIKKNLVTLPSLPKNSCDEAKEIKENISKILKDLVNMTSFLDKEDIVNSIYQTKDYVVAIVDIITKFSQELEEYKSENDLYEYVDIAKMAISILENNSDICDEIKNSLNEILIDEYQDTNDLQDLFISFIENNNVYMVGDIKQSIYRFRNANPNLFKSKYDAYNNLENGIKIDLNKNFRSRKEVLNNINLIFDLIMDNELGGADYSLSHRMVFGNSSYEENGKTSQSNDIEIYNYPFSKDSEYKKEEIEAFIIANDIRKKIESKYKVFDKDDNKLRDIDYSDIAILMDRATNFDLYKKIFEYLNIPLTIYKDESITDSVDIGIIKNIIKLIINKDYDLEFKYSFISILRSYLFNLDDNEIFNYFVNNNYNESLLMGLIDSIDYNSLTPKELILKIIDVFGFYEKIITVGDVEKHIVVLDYLMDISSSLTNMGYTIQDFYEYLESVLENGYDITYDSFKNPNAVKIMTIHASKGLEFNLCYYAGMYAKFNTSDLKERFIFDNNLGIISPYFDNGIRNTIYKDLLKDRYLKDEIAEKIRLLYVALTRAKEKMIIVAPLLEEYQDIDAMVSVDDRLNYLSFLDIIMSIKSRLNPYIKNVDLENLDLTHKYNFIKKGNYKDLIKTTDEVLKVEEVKFNNLEIAEKHFSKEIHSLNGWDTINNMKYGRNIHSIFENIDFINPDCSELSNPEKNMVDKFINLGILENVINVYKEYEFVYVKDNIKYHGIIDLLLEYDDEFKIVDYKLKNIDDEAYLNQLNGYKDYI